MAVPAEEFLSAGGVAQLWCRKDATLADLEAYERSGDRAVVLQALENIDFPESKRHNVKLHGDREPIRGMCLGMTQCYFKGPMPSRAVKDRPNVARLLCALARRELPGFTFTSIQVNKDYAAALHVDKNDAGDSYIIGLGAYEGGELWIDDGSTPAGRAVDLRGQWHRFDGNLAHRVLPFSGRRYTLIYFSRVRGGDVGKDPDSPHARYLLGLGFPLPARMPTYRQYPSADERLLTARARFARFCEELEIRSGVDALHLRLRWPDGGIAWVALRRGTPLGVLAEEARKRLGSLMAEAGREAPPWEQVFLRWGSMELLPSDTACELGLHPGVCLDVVVVPPALCATGEAQVCCGLERTPSPPSPKRQRQ